MKYCLSLIIIFFISGCANQTAPTGGPKDEDPPVLLSSDPLNRSINFSQTKIELEFDEYLKLNNVKEQIIISPRIDQEYELKLRKNKVLIEFEQPLDSNTTYTINFREAIQDITEGNSPTDLKLAFSTGSYLDSLSISGNVKYLLTDEPASEISIFLYDVYDTMEILEDPPLYFTKTTEEGNYLLENLKKGHYYIYALTDNNKNLMLDMKSEKYGFLSSSLYLDSTLTNQNLLVQYLDARPIELKSARQNGTTFEVTYDKYLSDYNVTVPNSNINILSNFLDDQHRVITFYNTLQNIDSTLFLVDVKDSIFNNLLDSIYVQFAETARSPKDFEAKVSLEKVFPTDGLLQGSITLNKPAVNINLDSAYLYLDSLNIIPLDTSIMKPINERNTIFNIDYVIDPGLFQTSTEAVVATENDSTIIPDEPPHIYIGRGAFVSPESDTIASSTTKLSFDRLESNGIILIEVDTEESSFIIQLLNSNFEVVQTTNNQRIFSFNKVKPGDYLIRILVDSDQNGRWDPGNIKTNKMPEPVHYYESDDGTKKLTIRANWELGPNIINF